MKPHLIRYWLTSEQDEQFEAKSAAINQLYHQAQALAEQGERVISNDELSGVQALERKHPGLPLRPGKVERHRHWQSLPRLKIFSNFFSYKNIRFNFN